MSVSSLMPTGIVFIFSVHFVVVSNSSEASGVLKLGVHARGMQQHRYGKGQANSGG